jgi:hypothetical protein
MPHQLIQVVCIDNATTLPVLSSPDTHRGEQEFVDDLEEDAHGEDLDGVPLRTPQGSLQPPKDRHT